MLQITYISTARAVDDAMLEDILAASRRNNRRDDVTGLLLFNGKRFLQAIEGPEGLVEAAYERIRGDDRHHAPVILSSKPIELRQFGHWEMAFQRTGGRSSLRPLAETVDALVAGVTDPNVRALFSSYVRLPAAA